MTRFDQTVDARMREISELVRSGATEMTGKTYRDESGRIAGRFGGGMSIMFPELQRAGMSPGEAAKAVEQGRGIRYRRLRRAVEDSLGGRPKKRSPGRLSVQAHQQLTAKCKHCQLPHTTGQHASHGAGAFHRTHLFSFGSNPMANPVTVRFTRYFTRGNLRGLTHDDRLSFPNVKSADRWIVGINRAVREGRTDYRITQLFIEDTGPRRISDLPAAEQREYNEYRDSIKPTKKNPPAVQIYKPTRGVVIQGMQKPPGHPCDAKCRAAQHRYRHQFKEPVEIIGLENGDVLLRAKR